MLKREAFKRLMRRLPASRLVFLDESGLNASMTRSHAWVKKGCELVERTPMNWGKNLTLLGAMRLSGWVLLSTMFNTTNKDRFVGWLVHKLLPRLKRGDILVLDNLKAHHDKRVKPWCKLFGAPAVPAAVLARPQPHRAGLGASKAVRPQARAANELRLGARRATRSTPNHRASLSQLVCPRRILRSTQVITGVR